MTIILCQVIVSLYQRSLLFVLDTFKHHCLCYYSDKLELKQNYKTIMIQLSIIFNMEIVYLLNKNGNNNSFIILLFYSEDNYGVVVITKSVNICKTL